MSRLPRAEREYVLLTHLNWSRRHLEVIAPLGDEGVWLDVTAAIGPATVAGAIATADAVELLADRGAAVERVTVSSDTNGAHAERDADGRLVIHRHDVPIFDEEYRAVAGRHGVGTADALFAVHPRRFLGVDGAEGLGALDSIGSAADLVVRDEKLRPRFVLTAAGATWSSER